MKKLFTLLLSAFVATGINAQDDVTVTRNGNSTVMSNGIVKINIGSNGRISSMTYNGGPNLLASNGIYFDYTADKNTSLNPSTVKIVKQTADYAEVLYSNTSDNIRFEQGFILRKGVKGVYIYVIANGTNSSSTVKLREARVCTRLNNSFLNGYVDDVMQGRIPSNQEMAIAEKDENVIQDATYRMSDGSIYTKYNWAQYIVRDSVHGLMNINTGVWNIACSHEYLNGGPMKQELTVHATSKSPITIQMLQGEHMGASAQYFSEGEQKLYGPFFIYVNKGSKEEMIADAKQQASLQQQEWPFEWFENPLYPTKRATVNGKLNVTTGQACDSVQVVLAEPGINPYLQGKKYIYWALTDKDGNFSIKNVRDGEYSLYAYATKGDVTDQLEKTGIVVDGKTVELGTVDWTPTCYEHKLWQIGQNNRMSDGFNISDTCRTYGLWELPPANLNYVIGESEPATDWYYAQTKNGVWTVTFNLDDTYTGNAHLTASVAGATNKPKVAVAINGTTKANWNFSTSDAAIYRSAVLGGLHSVQTCEFPASLLKKGTNTVTFTMSGIGKNGGVMYDCIKLEAGEKIITGITDTPKKDTDSKIHIYTLTGMKIGTYDNFNQVPVKGLYIYHQGSNSGKVIL